MIAKLLALLALLSLTAFLRDSPHSRAIGVGCPNTQKLGIFHSLLRRLVVTHLELFAVLLEAEGLQAKIFVILPILYVNFQIELITGNTAEY